MNFDDEFDELASLAYRTAFRILGSRGDAEDIAQDTLAKALVRWSRVQGHARAWVCRVAMNESIGVLRHRKRRRRFGDTQGSPASADTDIERLDLQRALLALPERQRDVLALRYLADLSESDVAHALGISVGTVKTHAHRALSTMRSRMADDEGVIADVHTP